ncbi:hypothetical protein [Rubrivivax benzoatilyticus]|uniref:hypothetical protein n=1 Tax=Rubrivivax benzoatilyticus TaxID=316997 RepID=UPI0011102541|nr:hypothetical protein [Rubrivivax benzoatilyticus]
MAACLGHRTYASLRTLELATLNQAPGHVFLDDEAGFRRAEELCLGIPTPTWREAMTSLYESGIVQPLPKALESLATAAKLKFDRPSGGHITGIGYEVVPAGGHWRKSTSLRAVKGDLPAFLHFDADGDACEYVEGDATPKAAVSLVVEFKRLGRRVYDHGELVILARANDTKPYIQDDELDDGDVYGMSES